MLKDREQKQQQRNQTQAFANQGTTIPEGSVTLAEQFTTPIHGDVEGDPVRILATGNVAGQSPSYLCVDSQGYSAWVPLRDVAIIDPNFLPLPIQVASRSRRNQ